MEGRAHARKGTDRGAKGVRDLSAQRPSAFRLLVSLCGLTLAEAADVTGQASQTAKMKNLGARRTTENDVEVLMDTWRRIRAGDVEGLPEGAVRMAAALALAEDIETGRRTPVSIVEDQFPGIPAYDPPADPAS